MWGQSRHPSSKRRYWQKPISYFPLLPFPWCPRAIQWHLAFPSWENTPVLARPPAQLSITQHEVTSHPGPACLSPAPCGRTWGARLCQVAAGTKDPGVVLPFTWTETSGVSAHRRKANVLAHAILRSKETAAGKEVILMAVRLHTIAFTVTALKERWSCVFMLHRSESWGDPPKELSRCSGLESDSRAGSLLALPTFRSHRDQLLASFSVQVWQDVNHGNAVTVVTQQPRCAGFLT